MSKNCKISSEDVISASNLLQKYKAGKASVENRIIENEQWWKLRHWDSNGKGKKQSSTNPPSTAWLFNSIASKHADAMDAYPEPVCLPREEADTEYARELSAVLPVILERCDFESVYSDCWYDKLKAGCAVYGVFWNDEAGDVDIRRIDVLNLFWEPGVNDIQDSKNVFHVELFDADELTIRYPELRGKSKNASFDVSKYISDDSIDTSGKVPVIDWYYKKKAGKRSVLHYCKFCMNTVLYSSENDEYYRERGFYDHGKYPFVFDRLFTIQGTPCGFGYIDVMKDTQMEIDLLSSAITQNAKMAATRRYFTRSDGQINEAEFADWGKPFVHYSGSGDPNSSVMPIQVPLLSDVYVTVLNNKISELKETSASRDFNQGDTNSGITAASAITALQEAGNKISRDMLKGTYRSFCEIVRLVIELIRQFYTAPRIFRITGEEGVSFLTFAPDPAFTGKAPEFDIKVRAQKQSPFARASQNELAKELYSMGLFNPQSSDAAAICIEMMDFEGRDKILSKIRERGDISRELSSMRDEMMRMASIIDAQNGTSIAEDMSISFSGL